MSDSIKCPVCGSHQIHAEKKGFSATKAAAGTLLTGDILVGALTGSLGQNKVQLTCLKCGHVFYPGDQLSIEHTNFPTNTDKFLADKKDLPEKAYFQCSCGKVSMLEVSSPYCPKCGRRLSSDNIVSERTAKENAPKGGCLIALILPLLFIGSLACFF